MRCRSRGTRGSRRPETEVGPFRQEVSTIDHDRGAGDIARIVRGEEQEGIGDVARTAKPPERDRILHGLDESWTAMRLDALGEDVPGLDAVHGDAVAGEFKRGRADEA